jgi:hypothetical protein
LCMNSCFTLTIWYECSLLIWRVLHEQLYYPFHLQRAHGFMPVDFPRRENYSLCPVQRSDEHFYVSSALFKDEERFDSDGVHNIHNQHQWPEDNSHYVIHSRNPHFKINTGGGIVGFASSAYRQPLMRFPSLYDSSKLLAVGARIWYV